MELDSSGDLMVSLLNHSQIEKSGARCDANQGGLLDGLLGFESVQISADQIQSDVRFEEHSGMRSGGGDLAHGSSRATRKQAIQRP